MTEVVLLQRNPYDHTAPLDRAEDCVGRSAQIKQAHDDLRQNRICQVIGLPKTGKTSFLHQLSVLDYRVMIVPCRQLVEEAIKSTSADVVSLFWARFAQELLRALELSGKTSESHEVLARKLRAMGKVLRDSDAFRPKEFFELGTQLANLRDVRIFLALDDFDALASLDVIDRKNLAAILNGLVTLYEAAGFVVSLLFTSRVKLDTLFERYKGSSEGEESRARYDRVVQDLGSYLGQPVVLANLTEPDIEQLRRKTPGFPEYVSREVYRESGGHPFLAQAWFYYAYRHNAPGTQFILWSKVLEAVQQNELVISFLRGIYYQLSREQKELLRIAMGTASRSQKLAIRYGELSIGQLPENFLVRPVVPGFVVGGRAATDEVMKKFIEDSSSMGLLFRTATEAEKRDGLPYLIRVGGNGSRRYVVSARTAWRLVAAGLPELHVKRRWWAYSDFRLVRLGVTTLFVILLLMLVLPQINVSAEWALVLSIVPLLYLISGLTGKARGTDHAI